MDFKAMRERCEHLENSDGCSVKIEEQYYDDHHALLNECERLKAKLAETEYKRDNNFQTVTNLEAEVARMQKERNDIRTVMVKARRKTQDIQCKLDNQWLETGDLRDELYKYKKAIEDALSELPNDEYKAEKILMEVMGIKDV